MRLIDADELIPMMKYATTDNEIGVFPIKIGFDAIVKVINAQPTIEPKPERKKGEWIYKDDLKQFFCSECGYPSLTFDDEYIYGMDKPNFCENCGADMRTNEGSNEIQNNSLPRLQ